MVYTITDIRFMFRRNPFNSQQVHITPNQDASLNKLVKHIETHPQEFIAVNPITDIKYVNIVSPNDLKLLDGVKSPFKHKNIDEYSTISNNIKRFMLATGMNLSRDVKSWIGNFTPSMAIISPTVVVDEQTNDVVEIDADADGDDVCNEIVVPEFTAFLDDDVYNENAVSSITIGMNYDSSNDKKLDYTEICNICLSIAKTFNNNNINIKDPAIVAIENKRRRDLLNRIAKYRRNREIAAVCSDEDLTKLTIEQLETVYAECECKFGQLKLKEVSRQILNIGSKAYDMLLPLGIPIGKGRHVTFNGIGDEIIKELHNSTSAVGLAYDNFIQKHNIHVSDEMSIISAIANIFIKNIHVTKDSEEGEEGEEEEVVEEEEEEALEEV
jgi:hypothetical protein